MTFSYDPTLPTLKDRVRRLLGDVAAPGLVADETILALLGTGTATRYVAAQLAEGLGAQFAVSVDKRIGTTQFSSSQRSRAYFDLAQRLRAGGPDDGDGSGDAIADGMYVGGADVATVDELRDDRSTVQPSFVVGQDDQLMTRQQQRSEWDV